MSSPNWFKRVLGFGPYFKRRSNAFEGMFVASFIGVISGVYIFKPLLDEIAANQAERKRQEALVAEAALNHHVNTATKPNSNTNTKNSSKGGDTS